MNEPINHHYLPVFYLKQWCGDDSKVVRYYRPRREVVFKPITPENTGYEPHLYRFEGFPPGLRALIETDYMGPKIDEQASKVLSLLLGQKLPATDLMRRAWARFLMSLALRNPQTLAALNSDMKGGGTPVLPWFIEELSKWFHAMRWFVFDLSGAATPLLTSDRPLFGQHGFGDVRRRGVRVRG